MLQAPSVIDNSEELIIITDSKSFAHQLRIQNLIRFGSAQLFRINYISQYTTMHVTHVTIGRTVSKIEATQNLPAFQEISGTSNYSSTLVRPLLILVDQFIADFAVA